MSLAPAQVLLELLSDMISIQVEVLGDWHDLQRSVPKQILEPMEHKKPFSSIGNFHLQQLKSHCIHKRACVYHVGFTDIAGPLEEDTPKAEGSARQLVLLVLPQQMQFWESWVQYACKLLAGLRMSRDRESCTVCLEASTDLLGAGIPASMFGIVGRSYTDILRSMRKPYGLGFRAGC